MTEKSDLKQGVVKQFSNGRVLGVVRAEEFMACSRCLSPCGRSAKARTLHGRPGPARLVLQVLFVCRRVRSGVLVGPGSDSARGWLKCCFTYTENVCLLGTGTQDVHLDFHTAPELCARGFLHGPCIGPWLFVCVDLLGARLVKPWQQCNGGLAAVADAPCSPSGHPSSAARVVGSPHLCGPFNWFREPVVGSVSVMGVFFFCSRSKLSFSF